MKSCFNQAIWKQKNPFSQNYLEIETNVGKNSEIPEKLKQNVRKTQKQPTPVELRWQKSVQK